MTNADSLMRFCTMMMSDDAGISPPPPPPPAQLIPRGAINIRPLMDANDSTAARRYIQ